MTLTRLTPLNGEAILPLADAKLHLRVRHDDEDDLIRALRDAAVSHIERISGVALAESGWRWTIRRLPERIILPMRPVVLVVAAISYLDASGVARVYEGARLYDGAVVPDAGGSWPYARGFALVEFTAGLNSPSDAPELIAAAKLMLGHLYVNRGAVNIGNITSELPLGVQALVGTHRMVMV